MSVTREEAIKQFEERLRVWDKLEVSDDVRDYLDGMKLAIEILKQPEIIRCKDCKHKYIENTVWNCPFGLPGGEEFFCGYGAGRRIT